MYTKSADYINELVFDYIETYSYRRGAEYEKLEAEANLTSNLDILYNRNIVDKNGQFFPYSIKTNTFQHGHPIIDRIKQLLQLEISEHLQMLCAPEYRDAIIFYDHNHRIVSCLQVCLSCFFMKIENCELKADYKTYGFLKKLFLEIGHNVEDPEYCIIDDMEKQIQKLKGKKR
jgi:hypothetical protein